MSPKASSQEIVVIDLGKDNVVDGYGNLGQVLLRRHGDGRLEVDWRSDERHRWSPISHFGGEVLRDDTVVRPVSS